MHGLNSEFRNSKNGTQLLNNKGIKGKIVLGKKCRKKRLEGLVRKSRQVQVEVGSTTGSYIETEWGEGWPRAPITYYIPDTSEPDLHTAHQYSLSVIRKTVWGSFLSHSYIRVS